MALGELGNFSAYGFAPASLVAPLGTTTVVGEYFNVLFLIILNVTGFGMSLVVFAP